MRRLMVRFTMCPSFAWLLCRRGLAFRQAASAYCCTYLAGFPTSIEIWFLLGYVAPWLTLRAVAGRGRNSVLFFYERQWECRREDQKNLYLILKPRTYGIGVAEDCRSPFACSSSAMTSLKGDAKVLEVSTNGCKAETTVEVKVGMCFKRSLFFS